MHRASAGRRAKLLYSLPSSCVFYISGPTFEPPVLLFQGLYLGISSYHGMYHAAGTMVHTQKLTLHNQLVPGHTTTRRTMPTSSTPAYRVSQNLRKRPGSAPRSFKVVFRSQSPQRPPQTNVETRSFDRSRAQILGPGSYDPVDERLEWTHDADRKLSSFASSRPNRQMNKYFDVHSRRLEENAKDVVLDTPNSDRLNRSVFPTAPGSRSLPLGRTTRFGGSHEKMFRGQEMFYDSGSKSGVGTLSRSLKQTSRHYASSFTLGVPARKPLATASSAGTLGPGQYTIRDEVHAGGITRARESWNRPTSNFAPRVGGKFGHVQDRDW